MPIRRKGKPTWLVAAIVFSALATLGVLLFLGRAALKSRGFGRPPQQQVLSVEAYLAQLPADEVAVTGEMALAHVYADSFRSAEDTHYSISLCTEVSPSQYRPRAWAYVPKDSEAGRRLYAALKDGLAHRITLRLKRSRLDGSTPKANEEGVIVIAIIAGA